MTNEQAEEFAATTAHEMSEERFQVRSATCPTRRRRRLYVRDDDYGNALVDTVTGEVIGTDGGEPETSDAVKAEMERLTRERDEARGALIGARADAFRCAEEAVRSIADFFRLAGETATADHAVGAIRAAMDRGGVACPACRGRGYVDSGSVHNGSVSCVACLSTGRISGERVRLLGEALLALRDEVEGRDSKADEVLRHSGLRLAEPAPEPTPQDALRAEYASRFTAADWDDADRKR